MGDKKIVVLKDKFVKDFKKGNPIIQEEMLDFSKGLKDGDIISIYSKDKSFLAKAYIGLQNKALGWVITYENENIDYDFFNKLIKKSIDKRKDFFNNENLDAFRILNAEGDNLGGITIDFIKGYILINWYNKGIYRFKSIIMDVLNNSLNVKGIYEKQRVMEDGKYKLKDDFIMGERMDEAIIINENNMFYNMYLNDGAMSGIFLDQREVRRYVHDYIAFNKSEMKRGLNTFSYTGAFTIPMAKAGIKETVSVDLAKRSLDMTKDNFYINNLDLDNNKIVVMDVFKYFDYAFKNNISFDIIILDPPSFARNNKKIFTVRKNYKDLIEKTLKILSKKGVILASTNSSTLDRKFFRKEIESVLKQKKIKYNIRKEFSLPDDFQYNKILKTSNYLKVLFIEIEKQ